MKNDIKFRVWKPTENRMDIIEFTRYLGGSAGFLDQYTGCSESDNVWLRFSGLKDKNGKEIYEGDILFHEIDDMNEVVIYVHELAMFKREYDKGHALEFGRNTYKYISVIGNIYENPELLKP